MRDTSRWRGLHAQMHHYQSTTGSSSKLLTGPNFSLANMSESGPGLFPPVQTDWSQSGACFSFCMEPVLCCSHTLVWRVSHQTKWQRCLFVAWGLKKKRSHQPCYLGQRIINAWRRHHCSNDDDAWSAHRLSEMTPWSSSAARIAPQKPLKCCRLILDQL